MLSDKEFDNLDWTKLKNLTQLIGTKIVGAESVTDGEKEVGVILYLKNGDGTRSVVSVNGEEWVDVCIARVQEA